MSFSSNVKQELCRLPINRKLEAAAELYGILLYCNAFTADLVRITTESRDLAERLLLRPGAGGERGKAAVRDGITGKNP